MDDFRSKSCREAGLQVENYNNNGGKSAIPPGMQDLRSYSTSYTNPPQLGNILKFKKGTIAGSGSSSSFKGWGFNDPELQRKKRVAGYKVYSVEGKMKGSLRKSFRWVKNTCSNVVYGWW